MQLHIYYTNKKKEIDMTTKKQYLSTDENGKTIMKEYEGYREYQCCGKKEYIESHQIYEISYCWNCMQKLIGTRQNVIRYGDIPANGKSYNHRENKNEDGVSCYLLNQRPRPEFIEGRNRLEFSAVIIGWGGDDEPLINAKTIKY